MRKQIVVIISCVLMVFLLSGCKSNDYKQGLNYYSSGNYDAAEALFSKLGEYKDSAEYLADIPYQRALILQNEGKYTEAETAFAELGDYKDSADHVLECRYEQGTAAFKRGDYAVAEELLLTTSEYKDSAEYLADIPYQRALILQNEGKYTEAETAFEELGDYKDSADHVLECRYEQAVAAFEREDYDTSEELLLTLVDYKDSTEYLADIPYKRAMELLENRQFTEAERAFAVLDDYKDSKRMVKETRYIAATYAFEKGDYDEAERLFLSLDDYRDSVYMLSDVRNERIYHEAESCLAAGDYDQAIALFVSLKGYRDGEARVEETVEAKNSTIYAQAEDLLAEGNYDEAADIFHSLGNYKDSSERAAECLEAKNAEAYAYAEGLLAESDYYHALAAFESLGDYRDSAGRCQEIMDIVTSSFEVEHIWFSDIRYNSDDSFGDYLYYDVTITSEVTEPFVAVIMNLWNGAYQSAAVIDGKGSIRLRLNADQYAEIEDQYKIIGYYTGFPISEADCDVVVQETAFSYNDYNFIEETTLSGSFEITFDRNVTGLLIYNLFVQETGETYSRQAVVAEGKCLGGFYISDLPYMQRDCSVVITPLLFCQAKPLDDSEYQIVKPFIMTVEDTTYSRHYEGEEVLALPDINDGILIYKLTLLNNTSNDVFSKERDLASIIEDRQCVIGSYDYIDLEDVDEGITAPEYEVEHLAYLCWHSYEDPFAEDVKVVDSLSVCLGSEPDTLDPALNSAVDGATLVSHLFSGLAKWAQDETGALVIVPDAATELVEGVENEDGTVTYTYTLRDGLKWSDGKDVTAGDFAFAWQRAASVELGADYGYMFEVVDGYDDVWAEEPPEGAQLNVKAVDDKTLKVTLANAISYWNELLAFPTYFPVREDVVSNEGWATDPSTYVCNGAYLISKWNHNNVIVLEKNPGYIDSDQIKMERLEFYLSDDANYQLSNFKNGTWQLIDDVPSNEIASLKTEYPDEFKVEGEIGTYYVCWNVNKEILPDGSGLEGAEAEKARAEIRNAINQIFDRNYIVDEICQAGQVPASSFVAMGMTNPDGTQFYQTAGHNDGFAGYYDVSEEALEQKEYEAIDVLLKYYELDYETFMLADFPTLTYLYNTSAGHKAIGEYLQSTLNNFGITMNLENREWATFLNTRKNGDYSIARNGWLADYNDPICFLEMWTTDSSNNDVQFGRGAHKNVAAYDLDLLDLGYNVKVKNGTWAETYDILIKLIKGCKNEEVRYELMHRAEDLLMSTGCICPLYFYTDLYMLSKDVDGFFSNPLGYKYFMYCTRKDGLKAENKPAVFNKKSQNATLSVYAWDANFNIPALKAAEAAFKKVNPGFELKIVQQPGSADVEQAITLAASSGDLSTLPDIVLFQDHYIQRYVQDYPKAWVSVDDAGIDWSDFGAEKISYSTVNGVHYGVPVDNGTAIFAYRTDILGQCGYTLDDVTGISWDRWLEIARDVKAKTGKAMLSTDHSGNDLPYMMLQAEGVSQFKDGKAFIADNESLKKIVEVIVQGARDGTIILANSWSEYTDRTIVGNQVAGVMNGNWILPTIHQVSDNSGKWAITTLPTLTGEQQGYAANGGSSLYITGNCKNLDLAKAFLAYTFGGGEGAVETYDGALMNGGVITSCISAGSSDLYRQPINYYNGQAIYNMIVNMGAYVPVVEQNDFHYTLRTSIGNAITNIINGTDIDTALKNAQDELDFAMAGW